MSMTVKLFLVAGGAFIVSAVVTLFREIQLMEEADAQYPVL